MWFLNPVNTRGHVEVLQKEIVQYPIQFIGINQLICRLIIF